MCNIITKTNIIFCLNTYSVASGFIFTSCLYKKIMNVISFVKNFMYYRKY